jgi:hypothetical protein
MNLKLGKFHPPGRKYFPLREIEHPVAELYNYMKILQML